MIITQKFSSANTSINSHKLPAIYNKIDWDAISRSCPNRKPIVLDWGCGKYTNHIETFLESKGFIFLGYDPYNKSEAENATALLGRSPTVCVCSNVLNVIQEDEVVNFIHNCVKHAAPTGYYFITVYEGNGTGVGRKSQDDCWQRNQKAKSYCDKEEVVHKGVITNSNNKKFVK